MFKKTSDPVNLLGIPNLIKALCYYLRVSIQTALELSLDYKLLNHFNESMSEEMQMNALANLEKLHFCHLKIIYSWNDLELIFLHG